MQPLKREILENCPLNVNNERNKNVNECNKRE